MRRGGAVLTTLGATALMACGGADDRKSTATTKLTGAPIKIGLISNETTPKSGLTNPDPRVAAQTRVQSVNARGGINGRPLELIACDGKEDPNVSANCARQMVDDGVVAVMGAANGAEAQIHPVLDRAGIAAIGVIPETSAAGESKTAFCFSPGVVGDFLGAPMLLKSEGASRISMMLPGGVPGTAPAKAAFEMAVKQAGVTNAGVITYTYGQSQFDAEVAKAAANGADGLFAVATSQTLAPLLQTVKRQQPDLPVVTLTLDLSPGVLQSLGAQAEGIYAVGLGQPATSDAPNTRRFREDIERYADEPATTDFAINAWEAVWVFEQVASKLATIDRASVLAAMRALDDFDMGGIYPPVTTKRRFKGFPGMSCVANPTVVFQRVEDGKLVAIDGTFVDPFAAGAAR